MLLCALLAAAGTTRFSAREGARARARRGEGQIRFASRATVRPTVIFSAPASFSYSIVQSPVLDRTRHSTGDGRRHAGQGAAGRLVQLHCSVSARQQHHTTHRVQTSNLAPRPKPRPSGPSRSRAEATGGLRHSPHTRPHPARAGVDAHAARHHPAGIDCGSAAHDWFRPPPIKSPKGALAWSAQHLPAWCHHCQPSPFQQRKQAGEHAAGRGASLATQHCAPAVHHRLAQVRHGGSINELTAGWPQAGTHAAWHLAAALHHQAPPIRRHRTTVELAQSHRCRAHASQHLAAAVNHHQSPDRRKRTAPQLTARLQPAARFARHHATIASEARARIASRAAFAESWPVVASERTCSARCRCGHAGVIKSGED